MAPMIIHCLVFSSSDLCLVVRGKLLIMVANSKLLWSLLSYIYFVLREGE